MTEKNWDKENMRTLSCRLRREEAERFRDICEAKGTTTHAALRNYVLTALNGEDLGYVPVPDETGRLKKDNAMLKRDVQAARAAAKLAQDHAKQMEGLVNDMLSRYDGID